MQESLNFLTTSIGSFPHKTVTEALVCIFNNLNAPNFPQLSAISMSEDMLLQFTEHFPGIRINEQTGKTFADLNSDEFFAELEELYMDFEEVTAQDELNDDILQKYAITENCACAFKEFTERLKSIKPKFVKGQIIGPFTFGTSTLDIENKCSFYDETFKDVISKTLTLKALWQVNEYRKALPKSKNIIFIDEPSLSQLGTSAYLTVSKDDVINSVKQIVDVLHKFDVKVGMHCCGKADWDMAIDTGIDIINFDAYFFAENFSLYSKKIDKFLNNGGVIAWGIVPTLDVEALENITSEKLIDIFENAKNMLVQKGIDEKLIIKSSILTPSCGAGSLSMENANKAMKLLKQLSIDLQKKYEAIL